MTPPGDLQSYDPADSTAAPTEHADEKYSEWEQIEGDDDNMLVKLERPRLRREFEAYLQDHTAEIQDIVSHHLSLNQHQHCTVGEQSSWMHGDFNACIPISVSNWRTQRLLLRCPFPHMLSGSHTTDKVDEKVRCEAATFAWISQNCAQVPIPRLWGFGLPGGLCFTPTSQLPWYTRILERLKDCWAWLSRRPRYAPFVPRQRSFALKSGYLLIDFIEEEQGTVLSDLWPPKSIEQKQNLYRSLAKVMLGLASQPQKRIGSLTVHNSGEITLSNRPLTLRVPLLENEDIPTNIPCDRWYSTVDSYVHDLLNCHDSRLTHQPNSVRDESDAQGQMAVLTAMRAICSQFTLDQFRYGPFIFRLTDLHASNMFVDRQYNITSIIDLEWGCFLPMKTQHPPFWLSGHQLDDLGGEEEKGDFNKMCEEFVPIFEHEDTCAPRSSSLEPGFCTRVMRDALRENAHWFWGSLYEPRGMYNLFFEHIQPMFAPSHFKGEPAIHFQDMWYPYWSSDTANFIHRKLRHREVYLEQMRSRYRTQFA